MSLGALLASSALEGGAVIWAAWELWSLRKKKGDAPAEAPPSADAAGHPVGEHPLDDR
ncbi:hypothetical protein BH09PSE2_BH09PSE2_25520 [soil metagenome]